MTDVPAMNGPCGPTGPRGHGDATGPSDITGSLVPAPRADRWGWKSRHGGPSGPRGPHGRGGADGDPDTHAPNGDDRWDGIPDSLETARALGQIGTACAAGMLAPDTARATAAILKNMDDIVTRHAARGQATPGGPGDNPAGSVVPQVAFDADGRPARGSPRVLSAEVVDTILDLAMEHQPQLIQDLEPMLDADQFKRACEYFTQWHGTGEPGDGGA